MSDRIDTDNETLQRQATETAGRYLTAAIKAIEVEMGTGAAASYPEIVASLILTASVDYGSSVIARAIDNMPLQTGE